ncbi:MULTISPECIES: nucleoside kinase [unclassified Barnesiella]|uniref:nucleoside kinase n=1 Tax=unclassified Barnesiella TaxID=2645177 RepID=UPI000B372B6F|nr:MULTISPECIES: nucleoside kinase [unclassified Barnesiella]MCR8912112.1 nucleoside kinase [Barnesiella sp. ET7]OUO98925.1 AAA family ATPase [Barnesiella sp. An22]HJB73259.1 nucleoside kinase [Candidatus Barnesiella merdigallinarum]
MEREKFDVFCVNTGKTIRVEGGESLLEIYEMAKPQLAHRPVCAYVNNKTEELRYRVYGPKDIEFLDITHPSGMRTYVRSLCFVMYKAIRDIVPGTRLRIEHSLSHGYYCLLDNPEALKPETIARIKERMAQIIAADIPFEKIECHTADAIEVFRAQGMLDKVELLQSTRQLYTQYHTLDGLADSYYSWLTPSTGYLQGFDLIKYNGGVLLVPPTPDDPTTPAPIEPQEKMLNAFKEYLTFNHIVGLSNIGDLNQVVENRQATDLIKVAEALHEKKISKIADDITRRYHEEGTRIVLISGPSSSGKTTFSKRLSIQLMTNLLKPVAISLDNYFVNREDTPRDETGDYDYESLYALDLDLFNKDLNRLLQGETVPMPTYNFETGSREYRGNTLKLDEGAVLILEGIHGLNPDLTPQIEPHLKYRIYVSALTTISIDDHNWIPTADNRLLRRIIRDFKYRGASAQSTIARWGSVRRGEEKWIFPYQENADAMFNSSLLFELAVMKDYAQPILSAVPHNCREYAEAHRLLHFLGYFQSINQREIPPTSLLREFLGGSSFKY